MGRPQTDRPHGYDPAPDDRCYVCRRPQDASVHTAQVVDLTDRRTASGAVPWSAMSGPQRAACTVGLIGGGAVFLALCTAVCAWLLRFAGLI